jgi:hypothetical protein
VWGCGSWLARVGGGLCASERGREREREREREGEREKERERGVCVTGVDRMN